MLFQNCKNKKKMKNRKKRKIGYFDQLQKPFLQQNY